MVKIAGDGGGGFYPTQQSGQLGLDGSGLGQLEAAINDAPAGSILELHVYAPFPWPDWAAGIVSAAVRPLVRLREVQLAGQDLIISWEA